MYSGKIAVPPGGGGIVNNISKNTLKFTLYVYEALILEFNADLVKVL
jgi:hypothetical protein